MGIKWTEDRKARLRATLAAKRKEKEANTAKAYGGNPDRPQEPKAAKPKHAKRAKGGPFTEHLLGVVDLVARAVESMRLADIVSLRETPALAGRLRETVGLVRELQRITGLDLGFPKKGKR